jgi:pseudouridine-5'-phosphate glycosidase
MDLNNISALQRSSKELDLPQQLLVHTSIEARARIEAEKLNEWINDALDVAEEWGD